MYLAGPIEFAPVQGATWRSSITLTLRSIGLKVYDPLVKPTWVDPLIKLSPSDYLKLLNDNDQDGSKGARLARKLCLCMLRAADFVLCYLPNKKTYGTTEELTICDQSRKPVLMVCPDGMPSSWILGMDNHIIHASDMEEAINIIRQIDNDAYDIDPYDWIFATYWRE